MIEKHSQINIVAMKESIPRITSMIVFCTKQDKYVAKINFAGPMLSAWLTPPIVPLLKVYVFNITNPAQVI